MMKAFTMIYHVYFLKSWDLLKITWQLVFRNSLKRNMACAICEMARPSGACVVI